MTNDEKPYCKIASTSQEWKDALGLVYRAYRTSGLIPPNIYKMRVTPYHSLPTTEVLIAKINDQTSDNDRIICTMSIVGDGKLGLPMENLYLEEIKKYRSQGKCLAEVSCLANEPDSSFSTVSQLMSLIAQCASCRGIDQLLIVVHPQHVKFYQRFLAFEIIGEQKTCPSVCDNLAVAMAMHTIKMDTSKIHTSKMDINNMEIYRPRAYNRLYGTPFDAGVLQYCPISTELQDEMRLIASETYVG